MSAKKQITFTKDQQKKLTKNDSQRTKCEVWTRVMGYHRPVSQFNKGKQSEHAERKHFTESVSNCSPHASVK